MNSDRDGKRGGWATPDDDQSDAESAVETTGEFTIDYAPPAWYTQNASGSAGETPSASPAPVAPAAYAPPPTGAAVTMPPPPGEFAPPAAEATGRPDTTGPSGVPRCPGCRWERGSSLSRHPVGRPPGRVRP